MQVKNPNHLKLKISDTFDKKEKEPTKIEAYNDDVVIIKAYWITNLTEENGYIMFKEKNFIEYKLCGHNEAKQSGEILIERAVQTTIKLPFVRGLFNRYDNADEVIKDYLFIEVN